MVGFQLVTGKDMFIGDYVKFLVYISSCLSQLYVLCWNGDSLIQHVSIFKQTLNNLLIVLFQSTETAQHLYDCNWEGENIHLTSAIRKYQTKKEFFINSNKKLSESIRNQSKWQEFQNIKFIPANKQFRQNLEIMIMCSQRPVKITALKFSTLSLQSFTAILSTSMSYFTLLQTVYNENKEELEHLT